ncbi:MAG: hypothetical protein RLZZ592_792 [Pseudomonadota bacterium]|jgi:diguanylate cyclase (GGDEF)-like protein|nr:hypothetical protein [Pseudomonadota bacterium]
MDAAFFPVHQDLMLSALAPSRHAGATRGDGEASTTADMETSPLQRLRTPVWLYDIDHGRILWANPAALGLWCSDTLEELCQRDMAREMSPTISQRLRQLQQDFRLHDRSSTELWTLYPRGTPRTVDIVCTGWRLPDGRMGMLCEAVGESMTDAVTLRSAEAMVHTPAMVTLYSVRGRALYRNPAARATVDHPEAGARSRVLDRRELRQLIEQLRRNGQARSTVQVSTSLGPRWHDISVRLCRDPVEGRQVFLVSEIDITELKQAEARAHWLAMRDTLTGLPNRSFVSRDFQQRLDGLHASGGEAALIFIDLDRFKAVNDSLGHDIGDRLLVEIAQRLYATLETDDLVARLGGDEFLVLVSDRDGDIERRTRQLVRRLQAELGRTVVIGRLQMQVTPSMGICRFPRDGHDIEALMRNADLALYRAKAQGNGVGWFTPELVRQARDRVQLEQDLRIAVERHQFEVHYQPRLHVGSGRLLGAEALVRWRHPRRGLVQPDVFIGLSEENGLIRAIGAMVLEKAARQQVLWQAQGRTLRISVNLSPRQFSDPALVDTIARIVRDTGCDPQQIELEITESVMLGQDDSTTLAIRQLAAMGFRLAIDDFGTGYSNLAYLQRCPISTLKIDRSFIAGERGVSPLALLVLTMCRMLGIETVAEGVETEAQLDWLRAQDCDEYQGHLCSPALPADQFERRMLELAGPAG